jgi:diguanylate cyclase (GGDEF)-like protein
MEDGPAILAFITDITERKKSEDRLQYLSTHDRLTGLYNRLYFEQSLEKLQLLGEYPVSIMVIDVDGLKKVNDTWGHAAGDELLKSTGEILARVFRGEDVTARIGGDEFVAVMPAASLEATQLVVKRLEKVIRSYKDLHPDRPILSLSVGVATASSGESLEDCLKQADQAMYQDKYRARFRGISEADVSW